MDREEALKIVRENYPHFGTTEPWLDLEKALATLIPELRESEDERIRKFLLDYAIEMIAGLESDISRSTYNGIRGHDPESEAELAQWQKARAYLEKQKEQKPQGVYVDCTEHPEWYGMPAKEQKPAEWSEEDEQLLGFIYDLIADSLWNSKYAMSRDECLDRLTSLRQHLQPRPSWKPSEEDEEPLSIV